MRFIIDQRIYENFPDLLIGVVVAHNIDNSKVHKNIEILLSESQHHIKQEFTIENLVVHPQVEVWRNAYRSFGSKPSEYRSSIENLYRMILKGKIVGGINPLVDIYNYISLKYMLPAGGEDLDIVRGDMHLTYATSDELPVKLLGDQLAESPYEGEIIYKDEIGTICRRWNWREVDRTKLTEQTRKAILVIEALPPANRTQVDSATQELARLINEFCGGTATVHYLDQTSPQADLDN